MRRTHARSLRQFLNRHAALAADRAAASTLVHWPVHVYLQIASACNLDCYMCSEHNRPPELRHGVGLESMPRAIHDKVADEVYPYSTMVTFGVGGEPTISPDFPNYLERAHRDRQEVHLITNGTRLYREEIADVVARCASFVQVSVDGATRETYERIRRGAHWSSLREGLATLQRIRARQPPWRRTYWTLAMVLMRSNVRELVQFVELAREFGADHVRAQHCIPATAEAIDESLGLEPELYDRERPRAIARARELGIEITLPGPYGGGTAGATPPADPNIPSRAIPCRFPTLDLFVLYDGRVFPCCHPFAHRKMQVGDLRQQSFAEIWNNPLYVRLREGLRTGDAPLACRTCSLVHDPPPAAEDPDAVERGPDLAAYYGAAIPNDGRGASRAAAPTRRDLARGVDWARLRRAVLRGRWFRAPEP